MLSTHTNKQIALRPESAQLPTLPNHESYGVPMEYGYGALESGGFDIRTILNIIRRWLLLILAITFMGTMATWWYSGTITPLYKATVTMEIQKQETKIFPGNVGGPKVVADREFLATQYVLMKSRSLAERVVTQLDLHNKPRYATQSAKEPTRIKQASDNLLRNLKVLPVAQSRIVNLQYISPDASEAARIVNVLAENFIEGKLERKYSDTAYARSFLEDRLEAAKESLEDNERKLARYAKDQEILELNFGEGNSSTLDTDSIVSLNNALSQARTERITAEQNYQVAQYTPVNAALESDEVSEMRTRLSGLKGEYEEQLSVFKPGYPKMVLLKDRIDRLEQEISTTSQDVSDASIIKIKADYDAALAKEKKLENYVNVLKTDLEDYRDRRIQYTILEREVDTARTQYDGLLQRYKEVTVASGVGASQVAIVDRASRSALPFSPRRQLMTIQALLLSAMLGLGLAWLLSFVDDTIKSPEDIKNKLDLPVLGVVPKVKGQDNLMIKQLSDPKSTISEAFYSARTSLDFATQGGRPRTLLLTSTQPREGKTSSAVSFAHAYAKIGNKVLIIDADMRKPSFVSDREKTLGLSGLLTGDSELMDNIVSSRIKGLYLLPTGVVPPNPAELLSGMRIRSLLKEAEEMFDIVIVDSPPLLGFADTLSLSSICEGTVIVFRSGEVRRPAARRTVGRLVEAGANIVGTLLTQFDAKRHGYEYGDYYYSYGYGAYSYEDNQNKAKASARKIDLFSENSSELET